MPLAQYTPRRLVLLDIDGLRYDVFQSVLSTGRAPHLSRLVGGPDVAHGIQFEIVSTAPSVTYCCQASSFTGAHPRGHWIPGNMFFDRFGRLSGGRPRKFEFDFVDAPAVYLDGLAGQAINPEVDTIYETAAQRGLTSTVAFNMYAHGAQHWLKPSLDDWRSFVAFDQRGFGERYDDAMLADVFRHLQAGHRPDVLTLYFFGLDHESHLAGPQIQAEYLAQVVDRQVGDFVREYERLGLMEDTLFVVFSDHGQIDVLHDDRHSLKVGFLLDREIGYLFQANGLDIYDHPLEGPNCGAILSPCGGLAHVYLRRKGGHWRDEPRFEADVLKIAQAFWDANQTGKDCPDLHGTLEMIAVRDVEHAGWYAAYQAYTPERLMTVAEYLAQHPEIEMIDAENRLRHLSSPVTGDILLCSRIAEGFSFSTISYKGSHGSLHPADSQALMVYCLPNGARDEIMYIRSVINTDIRDRCRAENNRCPGNVDVTFGLRAAMGWY
jgi:hypothetical protein